MATAVTLDQRRRRTVWKDETSFTNGSLIRSESLRSPCNAAWRDKAHRERVREWLETGEGLQFTLIVVYEGIERFAVFHREWRIYNGERMMVAVDRVAGEVFGGVPA